MDLSPAGREQYAPGRDRSWTGRSSHPATDPMLVAVGGVSFLALVAWQGVEPWTAIGPTVALVSGLKLAVCAPAGAALLRDKVHRFMRS